MFILGIKDIKTGIAIEVAQDTSGPHQYLFCYPEKRDMELDKFLPTLLEYLMKKLIVVENKEGLTSYQIVENRKITYNKCVYCKSEIGKLHTFDCITFKRKTKYNVVFDDKDIVGTYTCDDPVKSDIESNEFHKNESCWCSNNALEDIKWLDNKEAKNAQQIISALPEDNCTCPLLSFEFKEYEPIDIEGRSFEI